MPTQITITDADLAALVQAATATLAKFDALADSLAVSVALIQQDTLNVADAVTRAIPQLQADVKVATDAVAKFHIKGPFISGGTM